MRPNTTEVLCGIGIACVLGTVLLTNAGAASTNPAIETLLAVRVASDVIEAAMGEAGSPPGAREAFVALADIRSSLDPGQRQLVGSGKDAWGYPLVYWTDGNRFLVASYGSDGIPDVPYNPSYFPWTALPSASTMDPRSDILVVDGFLWRGPLTSRDASRRAMADLRSAATAIESYTIDFSFYPTTAGFESMEVLRPILEPIYHKRLPVLDPWGEPFGAWSRLNDGYAFVSYGSDRIPEHAYEGWGWEDWNSLQPKQTVEPGRDLIFVHGRFVQWPLPLQP